MTYQPKDYKELIGSLKTWLQLKNFFLMEDGTYHNVDWAIRVVFKERVVRIDVCAPELAHRKNMWVRLASCPYHRITFDDNGVPNCLGFHSVKPLMKIAGYSYE